MKDNQIRSACNINPSDGIDLEEAFKVVKLYQVFIGFQSQEIGIDMSISDKYWPFSYEDEMGDSISGKVSKDNGLLSIGSTVYALDFLKRESYGCSQT